MTYAELTREYPCGVSSRIFNRVAQETYRLEILGHDQSVYDDFRVLSRTLENRGLDQAREKSALSTNLINIKKLDA